MQTQTLNQNFSQCNNGTYHIALPLAIKLKPEDSRYLDIVNV